MGTICSKIPEVSRASRTRPVVALVGTTAVSVCAATSAVVVTVCSERLPLSSSVVKTSWSPATRPLPATTIVCPTLAEAMPALAGVPLAAVAPIEPRWLAPAAKRSRLSV